MFIAMNRFQIAEGKEADFINIWKSRETFLDEVPGFTSFNLLQGATDEGITLFTSHSVWESRQAFEDWTHSEAFRKAHANAGGGPSKDIHMGPPKLELFDVVI
ncbi:Heme oxygenase (staphylobilin-producing) 2 [BD1-7 clade bacterium]|uniref:Heme oxygenase (Staphylobilin-producing) 2 n=1 Tax=BD1-7 clade bacterium TaxID=2029982 RepID=A0A5S9MU40_9GAMM|nr:Heme oxygenase (staphylobilin-producing) 2 [BD1-7 clade bacterium]CAA0084970.1 Heme oxygenase (staphylobilin-producing) 2 [BD1-7 clade bacterium]CAA0114845.1 Heme oxygenase (staphylobilin-producing) 2 [BD1-7 clade bacterium]